MRIGEVIGTVTLSRAHPSLANARWVIAVPFSLKALRGNQPPDGEDLVVFDNLGAGHGHRIAFTEGTEAAAPFHPQKKPVDAYCACIVDTIHVNPKAQVQSVRADR
jgi:ethanolamine utilization protein EutN